MDTSLLYEAADYCLEVDGREVVETSLNCLKKEMFLIYASVNFERVSISLSGSIISSRVRVTVSFLSSIDLESLGFWKGLKNF